MRETIWKVHDSPHYALSLDYGSNELLALSLNSRAFVSSPFSSVDFSCTQSPIFRWQSRHYSMIDKWPLSLSSFFSISSIEYTRSCVNGRKRRKKKNEKEDGFRRVIEREGGDEGSYVSQNHSHYVLNIENEFGTLDSKMQQHSK